MSRIIPTLMFRSCSSQSAGRLQSGQIVLGSYWENGTRLNLAHEFLKHSDKDGEEATWLVSTTDNFMRAVHIAFQKQQAGEDDIEIIFIEPGNSGQESPQRAKELAHVCGFSTVKQKLFEHEYLFVRQIPDQCILHRVDLDTLGRRGFTIERLIGHVPEGYMCLTDFCNRFKHYWKSFRVDDRSCSLAIAACCFGLRAPLDYVFWALFYASTSKGSQWGNRAAIITANLSWAKEDYLSDVGRNYLHFQADLDILSEEWCLTELEHEDRLDELVYSLLDDEPALDRQRQMENERHRQSKNNIEKCIEHTYVKIGY